MKIPFLLPTLLACVFAAGSLAADETAAKDGCKMMKKEPAPEPVCCCQKMMAKAEAPAKTADLDVLVDKLKTAKGDQALEAFAAVLNQILADRKGAAEKAPEAGTPPAPAGHQH